MKNRALWATAAGTAAAALVLTGCTGSSEADTAGDGVVDVWVAFTDDARLGFVQEKAAEFEQKHEGVTVKVQGFDNYETLFQQMQLALDGGDAPEIVHYFEAATREALDAVGPDGEPVFQSVSAATGDRDEILGEPVVLDDVVAPAKNYYSVDGEFYSMPWNTSSTIMYGNQTMMDEAGIDAMPETWQDLEAACDKIAKLADGPEACITWPNHSWWMEQAMGQADTNLGNNDNGRSGRATEIDLDSDAMVDYLTWWQNLEKNGDYLYTGVQRDWDGTRAAFSAQQVAFLMSSSGDAAGIDEESADGGYDVVAGRMPYDADTPYGGNLIGGATLWLRSGLDEDTTDASLAFLNFFNNPENAAEWHKVSGYVPITNSAVDLLTEEGWFDENPNFKVASDQLALAADTPASTGVLMGNFVAIRDVITAAAEDILVQGDDVEERLHAADDEAQQLLDDYELLYSGE
ncbi:extracellular solute-binding protein [Myceligenerans indicum]|uniref:Extracellular solute-binding protein n=1 Tax=Myceligenerans indicum TaxID=2593663 RepID=A0ABS1LNU4_9MICO|nr:extracellular solute-binding protein [Myceligenerans indicum]MBL0887858.1 extracellular solute-binding protein [Myceligenerans indicum]